MLREIMDVLEFLDDARNGANPFVEMLPKGPQTAEITLFESEIGGDARHQCAGDFDYFGRIYGYRYCWVDNVPAE